MNYLAWFNLILSSKCICYDKDNITLNDGLRNKMIKVKMIYLCHLIFKG